MGTEHRQAQVGAEHTVSSYNTTTGKLKGLLERSAQALSVGRHYPYHPGLEKHLLSALEEGTISVFQGCYLYNYFWKIYLFSKGKIRIKAYTRHIEKFTMEKCLSSNKLELGGISDKLKECQRYLHMFHYICCYTYKHCLTAVTVILSYINDIDIDQY